MADSRSIGHVEAVFRYPVKSMAGEPRAAADVGWYGIDGDRRFALRRVDERGGMPWLTASKLPALLRYTPLPRGDREPVTHVRAPDGRELAVDGDELVAEIARLHGRPVDMIRLRHGVFDEGALSLITAATVDAIGAASGRSLGVRQFRPNIVIRTERPHAFEEDEWVGATLVFGEEDSGLAVSITHRDERCAILNLDPDTARSDPEVLKAAVRLNDNHAGVYGSVTRCGPLVVGQRVAAVPR